MRAHAVLLIALVLQGCSAVPAIDTLEIRNATVIDPASGTVTADRCIRISGETIMAVADCAPTPGIPLIDARGHWVIPGLWDMHVHSVWHSDVYESFFDAFIRFGVVGIRDMGGNLEVLQQARWFLEQPYSVGPYLVAAGPMLDGPQPIHPSFSLALKSREDGIRAVRHIAERGVDFVKLYTLLPGDAALGRGRPGGSLRRGVREARQSRRLADAHADRAQTARRTRPARPAGRVAGERNAGDRRR
jgi:hypothetical protein